MYDYLKKLNLQFKTNIMNKRYFFWQRLWAKLVKWIEGSENLMDSRYFPQKCNNETLFRQGFYNLLINNKWHIGCYYDGAKFANINFNDIQEYLTVDNKDINFVKTFGENDRFNASSAATFATSSASNVELSNKI